MNIEELRKFCLSLPSTTEDIKWENDLCFSIGGKLFCVCSLEDPPKASFKVEEHKFQELVSFQNIIPAPYSARYDWVLVQNSDALRREDWEHYVWHSYRLVRSKLPKKVLRELDPD